MSEIPRQLVEQYTAALQEYLRGDSETALLRAYELGRDAVSHKLSVLEMVAVHQEALVTVLLQMFAPQESMQVSKSAEEFLAESLVSFELVQRSAQEGNIVLRHVNEELAQQISERTEELKRQRDFSQSLINTTQDAVVVIDDQRRIVLFNPAAERMFGYTASEMYGQQVNILMPEPYAGEHDSYIDQYEHTGEPHAIGRVRTVAAQRRNGEVFPIELSVTEIKGGSAGRYGAFIRDISEKVKLQEELLERERLAAIGTTAATFAHEVGNPLNSMFMAAQLLERRLVKLEDPASNHTSRLLQVMTGGLKRLTGLLEEFRALARRQKLDRRPIPLATLVTDVLTAEIPYYETCGIHTEHVLSPDLPLINADSEKLRQVLLNLCKNAVEAMPEGGTLTVSVYPANDQVRLEVSDTGVGIPVGVNILEPFVTTKTQGSGLGLAIVRQIVTAHGGTLTYQSVPGQGTTFAIEFPQYLGSEGEEDEQ